MSFTRMYTALRVGGGVAGAHLHLRAAGRAGQGVTIVPLTFCSSTPAPLRETSRGDIDRTAQVELEKVKGTIVSGRGLHSPIFRLDVSTFCGTRWVVSVDVSDINGSG